MVKVTITTFPYTLIKAFSEIIVEEEVMERTNFPTFFRRSTNK
jgi:hypothetical protein